MLKIWVIIILALDLQVYFFLPKTIIIFAPQFPKALKHLYVRNC
jgi:hypothetical protein